MYAAQEADDRRVKVSLSLDKGVLIYVDTYVAAHPELNRSRVVEQALREFRQRQVEVELEVQYAEPETEEIQRELEAWRHVRRAAIDRRVSGT